MDSNGKSDNEKNDDSDVELLSPSEEAREINGKKRRTRKRRREIDLIKSDMEVSNDDDSESEDQSKRTLTLLGSPAPHSPGHSAGREPRSCVLNQRQKRKPLSRLLEHLLKNLEKKDQNQFFAWPVTDNYAPNYSTIIKRPMDFSTIKQKIDDNMYKSLNCFISDFKLMCNNALKYNKSGTVYHKAARKLLHLGMRQMTPAKLRPLGSILTYMYEIPIRELGFDMGKMDVKALKNGNSSTENQEDDAKETLSADDMVKIKMEEVREQHRKRLAKKAFPRMDSDGFTSLQVLVDNDGMSPSSNKRPVSLGLFTGRIALGTGTLQGFKEDRRNAIKGVKPLNYGAFGSYAPSYDSTFATISKEESHLVYHTYGEETGLSTNENLLRFSTDSPWNCIYNMEELFPTRNAARSSPEKQTENSDVKVNIDQLKTLSDLGIDIDFLADIEEEIVASQQDYGLKHSLHQNLLALKKLENEQKERLSQPIPAHLSNIAKPSLSEQETARTVVHNLKEMVSQVKPYHVVSLASVRKAMGVTLDHLDTPMTIDELHEISPEHAIMADQLLKENQNQNSNNENQDEENCIKSENDSSVKRESGENKHKSNTNDDKENVI